MGFKDKLRNIKECRINSGIYDIYYNDDIDENIAYLESRNGNDFTGNIFRIAEALSTGLYGDFEIYVFANGNTERKINILMKNYTLNIHKIITDEDEAVKILHKAKYIFTDSGIRAKYIKKEGQIFINTWHGTPLKLMGFDNPTEKPSIGIIQRSLLFSDYLLYPNDFMEEKMLNAFMIEKIYTGKILHEGYPRNCIFFDDEKRNELKKHFDLTDKEVYVYMPTFKGIVSDRKDEKQKDDVSEFLREIDKNLKTDQILFTKLHPYNQSQIDFTVYSNVKAFPQGYETYDILNMADCLITDYSSVFFDFANTQRKIIIFNYDEEEYLSDRGLYFPLSQLPFPKADNITDLIGEMNLEKNYDDSEFITEYCRYERSDAIEAICERVFLNKDSCKFKTLENNKANILIYAGNLKDDELLSSLTRINTDENNIFVSFKPWDDYFKQHYMELLDKFPEGIEFLPLAYNIAPTVSEKMDLNKFVSQKQASLPESLKKMYRRFFKRQYGGIDFDWVVDMCGSDINESMMLANSGHKSAVTINGDRNMAESFDYVFQNYDELTEFLNNK